MGAFSDITVKERCGLILENLFGMFSAITVKEMALKYGLILARVFSAITVKEMVLKYGLILARAFVWNVQCHHCKRDGREIGPMDSYWPEILF